MIHRVPGEHWRNVLPLAINDIWKSFASKIIGMTPSENPTGSPDVLDQLNVMLLHAEAEAEAKYRSSKLLDDLEALASWNQDVDFSSVNLMPRSPPRPGAPLKPNNSPIRRGIMKSPSKPIPIRQNDENEEPKKVKFDFKKSAGPMPPSNISKALSYKAIELVPKRMRPGTKFKILLPANVWVYHGRKEANEEGVLKTMWYVSIVQEGESLSHFVRNVWVPHATQAVTRQIEKDLEEIAHFALHGKYMRPGFTGPKILNSGADDMFALVGRYWD